MRKMTATAGLALLAALALTALPMTASAELEVTRSSAPALKPGTKLPDGARISVPAGAEVTIVQTPPGSTHVIRGQFDGTLAEYASTRTGSQARPSAPATGATRGVTQPKANVPGGVERSDGSKQN